MGNKAIFLDRDGTLIDFVPYLRHTERVKLKKDVVKRAKFFQDMGYLIVIITNQSGISRGLLTLEDYEQVNARMLSLLKEEGLRVDAVYHCDSSDDSNERRKPNPGMLWEASKELDIDLENSVMVGDRDIDIECGERAGCGYCFLVTRFLE